MTTTRSLRFYQPMLVLLFSYFGVLTTSTAQTIVPSEELDSKPYLTSCKNSDSQIQEQCSNKTLLTLVYSNINYPETALAAKAEGMAVIEFVIGKDGALENVKIIRSSDNADLDAAAVEVVNAMKNTPQLWEAGRKDGKAVRTALKLPVKFKLS